MLRSLAHMMQGAKHMAMLSVVILFLLACTTTEDSKNYSRNIRVSSLVRFYWLSSFILLARYSGVSGFWSMIG